MTPTPTDTDKELTKLFGDFVYESNGFSIPAKAIINDMRPLEKEAWLGAINNLRVRDELCGRLHELIEAFQNGAIKANYYLMRHGELTDRISEVTFGLTDEAELEKGQS